MFKNVFQRPQFSKAYTSILARILPIMICMGRAHISFFFNHQFIFFFPLNTVLLSMRLFSIHFYYQLILVLILVKFPYYTNLQVPCSNVGGDSGVWDGPGTLLV